MGQVYLARRTGHGELGRQVVIKTLDAYRTNDAVFVDMFLEEARLLGELRHRCIPTAYELGYADDTGYYVVMDYVHGETADAVFHASVERSERLPLAFGCSVVSSIAAALDYAHAACSATGEPLGVVHRDVSLSNVMVGHDGAVKLIDFGVARVNAGPIRTLQGALKGKLGYLAPEMILHTEVDHRADIFALGIVLYELTTTTRAFDHESPMIALERVVEGVIVPPSQILEDYPPELEAIVMKAMRVDPSERYATAGEMGREVERVAHDLGLTLDDSPVLEVMAHLFRPSRRRLSRGTLVPPPSEPPSERPSGRLSALARAYLADHGEQRGEGPTATEPATNVLDELPTDLDRGASIGDAEATLLALPVTGNATEPPWFVLSDATELGPPVASASEEPSAGDARRTRQYVSPSTEATDQVSAAAVADLARADALWMQDAPPTLQRLPPPPPRPLIPPVSVPVIHRPITSSPIPPTAKGPRQRSVHMWGVLFVVFAVLAGIAAAFAIPMLG